MSEDSRDSVLGSEDLLGILLSDENWCGEHKKAARVVLSRVLRLKRVSKLWRRVADAQLDHAQSIDMRGLMPSDFLHPSPGAYLRHATELVLDGIAFQSGQLALLVSCSPSLTALSIKRCDRLVDTDIAEALKRCGQELRSLSLAGTDVRADSIVALTGTAATRPRHLTTLDLSGCSRATSTGPMRLDLLWRACATLARVNLSCQPLGAAIIGSVLTTLSSKLTHLQLNSCGLDDDQLCVDAARADSCRWRRMWRLRTLGLADNPRVSGLGVSTLLACVPSLASLDCGGLDVWPSEVPTVLDSLCAAPSLRRLSCLDAGPWLDPHALRRLQSSSALTIEASSELWSIAASTPRCGGASRVDPPRPAAPPLESWEDLEVALADEEAQQQRSAQQQRQQPGGGRCAAQLPASLNINISIDIGDSSAHAPPLLNAASVHASSSTSAGGRDYSRPPRYHGGGAAVHSIYHVSSGDQPYYRESAAGAVRSETDAHGLRT